MGISTPEVTPVSGRRCIYRTGSISDRRRERKGPMPTGGMFIEEPTLADPEGRSGDLLGVFVSITRVRELA